MTAWICESCGRPNDGDLCPGCAQPRPFNIKFGYIGSPENYKFIEVPTSKPSFQPVPALLLVFPTLLVVLTQVAWWIKFAAIGVAVAYFVGRYLLVKPRLALYRWLKR